MESAILFSCSGRQGLPGLLSVGVSCLGWSSCTQATVPTLRYAPSPASLRKAKSQEVSQPTGMQSS